MDHLLRQALIAHFNSVFAGPNGDYPAVMEALEGVTAARAAWKPGPDRNSIWQIVDHLAASKVWQIEMLETGRAAAPLWTEPGSDESAWQATVGRLADAHARLKAALGQVADDDLLKIPQTVERQTLLELLLSSAAHEAHHAGQVDYLKGLFPA
jgi:uncharacterized damage-inducible protein DinB